ncbi:MAG: DUF2252 family protein, partial [Dongiaceae bacterium]
MARDISITDRLAAYNEGRVPVLLARKYQRMAADAFAFFRGTGHLFHEAFPKGFGKYPIVWLNGDLHLENFGTYRGENRLTYFDIGDFDEGGLGPASRDLLRFLTGLHLAMPGLTQPRRLAGQLGGTYLAAYASALQTGKALWLERRLADGLIGDLMHNLELRQKDGPQGSSWLRNRVAGLPAKDHGKHGKERHVDQRHLRLDSGKFMTAPPRLRRAVEQAIKRIAKRQARHGAGDWQILDIAWRIAGLGTLGLPRFCILIRVDGNPRQPQGVGSVATEDDLLLLDLKAQPGSAMLPCLRQEQPVFASEGERVVAVETRLQAVEPAFLTALQIGKRSFTLRELQPEADKLDLAQILASHGRLDPPALQETVATMGRLTAWAQLRSAGRQGSADADELIDFAAGSAWQRDLLTAAKDVAGKIEA